MKIPIFGHLIRPEIDSQNTGRAAYARPFSVANVTVNGAGGFSNFRSLSPFSPDTVNLAFVTTVSLTGNGNALNTNPEAMPLINKGGRSQF